MFNATPEQLEEARADLEQRRQGLVFEVWPENWRAFVLFANLGTQWDVVAGPSGLFYLGLKYSSLPEVERRVSAHADDAALDDASVFQQLRTLEVEALQHLNTRE